MNPRYVPVAARAGHRCEYCRAPEAIFNLALEVEHIVPSSQGGTHDDSNLALACRACNVHKASRLTGVDEVTGENVRLFHPRLDLWEDHFGFEPMTWEIVGQTAIGRVTVASLRMNQSIRLTARGQWMRLGIFP
jgi:hypothetical protein